VTPPPSPDYAGQVPAGPPPQSPAPPAYAPPVPERKRGGLSWLWAGIGCVVVVLCIGVVGLLLFDMLNLYCTPPFDALFGFIYTCP
jgi:hypothetical protein